MTEDAAVLATSPGCPRQIGSVETLPSKRPGIWSEAVDLLIAADGEDVLEEQSQNPDLCSKT